MLETKIIKSQMYLVRTQKYGFTLDLGKIDPTRKLIRNPPEKIGLKPGNFDPNPKNDRTRRTRKKTGRSGPGRVGPDGLVIVKKTHVARSDSRQQFSLFNFIFNS